MTHLMRIFRRAIKFAKAAKSPRSFETYDKCLDYCIKRSPDAYESKLLCAYRFEKLQHLLKERGVDALFSNPLVKGLQHAILLHNKYIPDNKIRMIDFGGGCGESMLYLKSILGPEDIDGFIIESEEHAKQSRNWAMTDRLKYSSRLDEILESQDSTLFFTSGAIQYLENPYTPLIKAIKSEVPIISLSRNNFSKSERVIAQHTKLSAHGIGDHFTNTHDASIYIPNTPLNLSKVECLFSEGEYRCVLKNLDSLSGVYGESNYGGDLAFVHTKYIIK